jgi:hypothetical protein
MRGTSIAAFWLLMLLTGCCSTQSGRDFSVSDFESKIVDGKTKQGEVLTMFGKPQSMSRTTQQGETWGYYFQDGGIATPLYLFLPITIKSKTGTVSFRDDVVNSHSASESQTTNK